MSMIYGPYYRFSGKYGKCATDSNRLKSTNLFTGALHRQNIIIWNELNTEPMVNLVARKLSFEEIDKLEDEYYGEMHGIIRRKTQISDSFPEENPDLCEEYKNLDVNHSTLEAFIVLLVEARELKLKNVSV